MRYEYYSNESLETNSFDAGKSITKLGKFLTIKSVLLGKERGYSGINFFKFTLIPIQKIAK